MMNGCFGVNVVNLKQAFGVILLLSNAMCTKNPRLPMLTRQLKALKARKNESLNKWNHGSSFENSALKAPGHPIVYLVT